MSSASDDPEGRALAARFLDLWQRQIQLAADDESMTGLFSNWLQGQGDEGQHDRRPDGVPSDITPTAGPASGDSDGRPDRGGSCGAAGG